MNAAALKRVEKFVRIWTEREPMVDRGHAALATDDLRAVLALAQEAAELKRRIRLARDVLGEFFSNVGDDTQAPSVSHAIDLLDLRKSLRKPLPRSAPVRPKPEHVECRDCDELGNVHRADRTHCECGETWPCPLLPKPLPRSRR